MLLPIRFLMFNRTIEHTTTGWASRFCIRITNSTFTGFRWCHCHHWGLFELQLNVTFYLRIIFRIFCDNTWTINQNFSCYKFFLTPVNDMSTFTFRMQMNFFFLSTPDALIFSWKSNSVDVCKVNTFPELIWFPFCFLLFLYLSFIYLLFLLYFTLLSRL